MSGNRAPLKDRVAELEALVDILNQDREIPDPILKSKGEFFGAVIAGIIANEGSRGMSETGLKRIVSNAERLWNTYVRIVRGDEIKLWEDRLREEREKAAAIADSLEKAKATIAAQTEMIRSLDGMDESDELPAEPEEEATPEEAAEAIKEDAAENPVAYPTS